MQFHIDGDIGTAVFGWMVSTRSDVAAVILVTVNGCSISIRTDVVRPDLVPLGIHATGEAGFVINQAMVPGLKASDALELRDSDTGLLIYRRPRVGTDLDLKFLLYTQNFGVQAPLCSSMASHFSMAYENCGGFPFAILFSVLNNPQSNSTFISGALPYHRYHSLATERHFATGIMLTDPLKALAESILALRASFKGQDAMLLPTHLSLEFSTWFESSPAFGKRDWLATCLNNLTENQRAFLTNPAVRMLACQDEMPTHRHIPIALEALANLNIVGVDNQLEAFKETVADATGVDFLHEYSRNYDPNCEELVRELSQLDISEDLIALDKALFEHVKEAVASAL